VDNDKTIVLQLPIIKEEIFKMVKFMYYKKVTHQLIPELDPIDAMAINLIRHIKLQHPEFFEDLVGKENANDRRGKTRLNGKAYGIL
jgi:hypothetical protein